MNKTTAPFIIVAPAYNKHSAGIRVLHTLCNELNLCGEEAYLIFYKFKSTPGADFYVTDLETHFSETLTSIRRIPESIDPKALQALVQRSIVIYPEVIQGNPLEARHVIRYVLNTPASNGYTMLENKNDMIVCFSQNYWPTPTHLLPILVDETQFNDHNTRPAAARTMDCTYFGKGVDFGECFKLPNSVMLERKWPGDKESLAIMLRHTRYLFTWDLVSQTNYDAVRCGAIPIVVRWNPYTRDIMKTEIGEIPHGEIAVVDGAAKILFDPDEFARKRAIFLANYNQLAHSNTDRVRIFANTAHDQFRQN